MEFEVLGTLRVVGPTGAEVRLSSASQRRLLCLLLQRPGRVGPGDHLGNHLELSSGALRTSVSRLRRVLGYETLVTEPPGYVLHSEDIDAVRFERLLHAARGDPQPSTARQTLEKALALWRGTPYQEFAEEAWAIGEVTRLEGLRADAVLRLAEILLEREEWSDAIERLDDLISAHPFDDRPRALVMRALAESGRRVEALRVFQDYRTLLAKEVGTEPAASTVELDRRIARGGTVPGGPGPHLPTPLTSFVGRVRERQVVAQLVRSHRLVTLTGSGGCGKSRLALEVANALTIDGTATVQWADLTPVAAPGELAAAMGENRWPGAAPTLLVIDGAEHLLGPVADLVQRVLGTRPHLRVLVTSRELLGLSGEMVWRVPPLSLPDPDPDPPIGVDDLDRFDALQLFVERSRLARPDLVIDESAVDHIVSICARLDGLPLGLELSAAHLGSMPLHLVAAGLDDAFGLPSVGARSAPPHHETLAASITWSVDRLDQRERTTLACLAVFRGPFEAEAALVVAADDDRPVADVLSRLVDKNLIQLDVVTGRYRMLQTIRQFCLAHLLGPELDRASARHAHHVARWCLEVGSGRHGIARMPFVRAMPDVVSAMEWARQHAPRDALHMCRGLASLRSTLGHSDDLADTWRWLLAFDRDGDLAAEWAAAMAATMAAATGAGLDVTGWPAEVGQRLRGDDRQAVGWLTRGAAMTPAYQGHLAPIAAYATGIVAAGYDVELSVYGGFAAYMLSLAGLWPKAETLVNALEDLARRHRVPFAVDTVGNGFAAAVTCRTQRGRLGGVAGMLDRADTRHPSDPAFSITAAAAIAQAAVLTHDRSLLDVAVDWARHATLPLLAFLEPSVAFHRHLFEKSFDEAAYAAARFWDEAAPVPVSRVNQRAMLNIALLETGRIDRAAQATDEAGALVAAMDDVPLLEAIVTQCRAQVAWNTGHPDHAVREAHTLLDLATTNGFTLLVVDALELLAIAEARRGADEVATWLLSATLAERDRLGYGFVMHTPRAERRALAIRAARAEHGAAIESAVATARLRRDTE